MEGPAHWGFGPARRHPPRGGGYPDSLDWLAFRRDDAIRLLHWRTALIRRLDPRHKVTAHSTGALTEIEWRTADDVDSYGYTWVASRHTNDPWQQFHAVDLVRAASKGKPFWHAEATGGPAFATCVGLLHFALSERAETPRPVRLLAGGSPGLFGRVGAWLRDNF